MTEEATRIEPQNRRGGEWVQLGLDLYRIPPLAFASVVELQSDVEGLRDMGDRPTPQQMSVVARIVHSAMARNYPSLKIDEVLDMLDLGNYQDVLAAVLRVAGYKKDSGDGAPGETGASVGTASTAP